MFVDHRLPGDKANDVERHIDECASCREILAALGRRDGGCAARGDERALQNGQRLGRYMIVGVLGRGGMGTVYAAFDPDLDRKIAIKLLRRGAATEADRARLLREAQALARVSHPGVIAVHDVGTFEDRVFLAMEMIRGGTLRTWLAACARGWAETLALLLQAARGLAAAHAAGLVHRDIKPDNILVDAAGRARISDFGLAFAVAVPRHSDPLISDSSNRVLDTSLTITGALVGTPAYMAPEQIAGRAGTALSDQFSFCVTLYEALYGIRPFAGASLSAIETAMYEGRIAESDRDVPSWLSAAVVRGLAVAPSRRHASMDALIHALEPAVLGSCTLATSGSCPSCKPRRSPARSRTRRPG